MLDRQWGPCRIARLVFEDVDGSPLCAPAPTTPDTAALLYLAGECVELGTVPAEDLAGLSGPTVLVQRADGSMFALIGLTPDECRACVPGLFNGIAITVSKA